MPWHAPTLKTFESSDLKAEHEVTSLVSVPGATPSLSPCSVNLFSFLMVHCYGHSAILFQLSTLKEKIHITGQNLGSLGFSPLRQQAGTLAACSATLGGGCQKAPEVLVLWTCFEQWKGSAHNNFSRKCWGWFWWKSRPLISLGYKVDFLCFRGQRASWIWLCLTESSWCILGCVNS